MSAQQAPSKLKLLVFALVLMIGVPVAAILLLEGGASLLLGTRDYIAAQAPARGIRSFTAHDTLLGWVNRTGFASPDEFGEASPLSIDLQGLRSGQRTAVNLTPALRVGCLGDALTFGYGVADDQTWCAMLASQLSGTQMTNMGQAGYSLDQMYLWYRRDGSRNPHSTVLVTLTWAAVERMGAAGFQGQRKPTLAVTTTGFAVNSVPVPQATPEELDAQQKDRVFNQFRTVQAVKRISQRVGRAGGVPPEVPWALLSLVLDSVRTVASRAGASVVLVYLPMRGDMVSARSDSLRAGILQYAKAHEIPFADLTPHLRSMRKDSVDHTFIAEVPAGVAPTVAGHYSAIGHAWVSRVLGSELRLLAPFNGVSSHSAPADIRSGVARR